VSAEIDYRFVIAAFYAAARTGDTIALRPLITADFEILWNGDPALIPWAGRHRGLEAATLFFETFQRHIEVVSVTPGETITAPGVLVTTVAGQWRVRDTEGVFTTRSCNILRLRDGRIAAYEVYNDTAPFVAALASVAG
jgi:uncharacterized protein